MLEPIGVERQSIVTSFGTMVYYTPTKPPWQEKDKDNNLDLPTLVFLHGFGGGSSAYEWSKVYPAFASDYRVIAPDLIGWGRSDHPERNYQPEDYVRIIIELIEKIGNNRPTPVIASALTAAFTIRAAIERPDLFKSLILTTPAGLSDFGEDYTRSFFAQVIKVPILDKLFYSAGVATENGILSFLQNNQFADRDRVYPEIVKAYLASARQPNAEYAALSFVRGDLCFDLSKYISQLTTPSAILWGRKSQFTGPEIGKRLAALNPEAVKIFLEIDEVGLTPQLELPAVTIGLIRKFLPLLND
jgi:pimeloyl-ACP methyl ester carboxylesterase